MRVRGDAVDGQRLAVLQLEGQFAVFDGQRAFAGLVFVIHIHALRMRERKREFEFLLRILILAGALDDLFDAQAAGIAGVGEGDPRRHAIDRPRRADGLALAVHNGIRAGDIRQFIAIAVDDAFHGVRRFFAIALNDFLHGKDSGVHARTGRNVLDGDAAAARDLDFGLAVFEDHGFAVRKGVRAVHRQAAPVLQRHFKGEYVCLAAAAAKHALRNHQVALVAGVGEVHLSGGGLAVGVHRNITLRVLRRGGDVAFALVVLLLDEVVCARRNTGQRLFAAGGEVDFSHSEVDIPALRGELDAAIDAVHRQILVLERDRELEQLPFLRFDVAGHGLLQFQRAHRTLVLKGHRDGGTGCYRAIVRVGPRGSGAVLGNGRHKALGFVTLARGGVRFGYGVERAVREAGNGQLFAVRQTERILALAIGRDIAALGLEGLVRERSAIRVGQRQDKVKLRVRDGRVIIDHFLAYGQAAFRSVGEVHFNAGAARDRFSRASLDRHLGGDIEFAIRFGVRKRHFDDVDRGIVDDVFGGTRELAQLVGVAGQAVLFQVQQVFVVVLDGIEDDLAVRAGKLFLGREVRIVIA